MELPELPKRLFTEGEEPIPLKSIGYHTDDPNLLPAVKAALHEDEWEELKNSRLGVFIKFWELKFGWASRLVHFMLGYQLDVKKKYELWSLIGSEPVRFSLIEFEHLTGLNCEYVEHVENPTVEMTEDLYRFWALMGVDIDSGPSSLQIITACGRCGEWSRDDRMRLGYLAIYTGFIEGRKNSTATRAAPARLVMDLEEFENYPWGRLAFKILMDSVKGRDLTKSYTIDGFVQVLQVWVYFTLPDFAAEFGKPIRNKPSPPLLAYKGHKGRKFVKEGISTQTRVLNLVVKEIGEMFPQWDNDKSDVAVENLVKLLCGERKMKWSKECWPEQGTNPWTNPKFIIVKHESVKEERRPRKKVRSGSETRSEAPSEARTEALPEAPIRWNGVNKEELEQSFKAMTKVMTDGFGQCLKEIKLLGERMEAVEKKVGISQKVTASNELQLTVSEPAKAAHEPGSESVNGEKARSVNIVQAENMVPLVKEVEDPSVVVLDKNKSTMSDKQREEERRQIKKDATLAFIRGKSERERKLAASQQSPFQGNSTAKVIVPKKKAGHGYDPFGPVDKKKAKVLADYLKKIRK